MGDTAIETLLDGLTEWEYGWVTDLPAVRFLGHVIRLEIDTRDVPGDGPPPPPSVEELGLVRRILRRLADVLVVAEREFVRQAGRVGIEPEVLLPQIWICTEKLEVDGPERWAFVVERDDAPDYGTHLEFNGLEFLDCWSGD